MVICVKLETHANYSASHPGAIIRRDLFHSVVAISLCIGIGAVFGTMSLFLVKTADRFIAFQTPLAILIGIFVMLGVLPLIAQVRRLVPFLGMLG